MDIREAVFFIIGFLCGAWSIILRVVYDSWQKTKARGGTDAI